MHGSKESQEICVMGRLLSLEGLVLLMGIVSFVHGLFSWDLTRIVMGALILIAAVTVACTLRRMRQK